VPCSSIAERKLRAIGSFRNHAFNSGFIEKARMAPLGCAVRDVPISRGLPSGTIDSRRILRDRDSAGETRRR
jgi:hypothetical protein